MAVGREFPTTFDNGKLNSSLPVARKRRKQAFDFAQKVHGGGPESQLPGSVGIIDTTLNKCSSGVLVDMLSTNKKLNSSVFPQYIKRNC